tara:strand:+ start:129 stop:566 length:438 start_codon:yes stop_codon:yes gene_type:complete
MDFGDLLEYLGPLAFLLIAFINNFFKKKKPSLKKPIKKVINEPEKEIKNFKDLIFDVKNQLNKDTQPNKEDSIKKNIQIPEKRNDIQIVKPKNDNKLFEKRNDLKSDSKKSKHSRTYKSSIKEKLSDKKSLKDAFILKEILEKKF